MKREQRQVYRWIAEIVIAVSTASIAVLAFLQSLAAQEESRETRRLSVHPFVGFHVRDSKSPNVSDQDEVTVGINIVNDGHGPAIVKYFSVGIRADPEDTRWKKAWQWADVLKEAGGPTEREVKGMGFSPGSTIKGGDSIGVVSVAVSDSSEGELEMLDKAIFEIDIKIEYESVYGVRCSRTIFTRPSCTYKDERWPKT